MPQFSRPISDLTNEGYTNQVGGSANLFQSIDEAIADDADYIQSALAPTNDVYVADLSTIEDPISSANHILRYRYGKSASGGAQIDQTFQLRQGYVNEGTPGTLIAAWTHTDVAVFPVAAAQTLTGPQADAITDYGDLQLRIVSNQV